MRTVQQLREQNETQAETIKRLNIDNLRLTRENAILRQMLDLTHETDTKQVPKAVAAAEQYFHE